MKHSVSTLLTRQALAASLRKLMDTKPLAKISVREIIEDCGVNRQTFYYHFQDISDLVGWLLDQETSAFVQSHAKEHTRGEAIRLALTFAKSNPLLRLCANDPTSCEHMRCFFRKVLQRDVSALVNRLSEERRVDDDYREFLTSFYTAGIESMLLDWLKNDAQDNPDALCRFVNLTVTEGIRAALERVASVPYP